MQTGTDFVNSFPFWVRKVDEIKDKAMYFQNNNASASAQ